MKAYGMGFGTIPDMLRISNGRIRRKDKGKLTAYLKRYQQIGKIKNGTPVCIITKERLDFLESRNIQHVS